MQAHCTGKVVIIDKQYGCGEIGKKGPFIKREPALNSLERLQCYRWEISNTQFPFIKVHLKHGAPKSSSLEPERTLGEH